MSSRTRAPFALVAPALVASVLSLVPVWYLFQTAFTSGFAAVVDELFQSRTLQLVLRSLLLMVTVTSASVVIGVFAAWVVARSPLRPRLLLIIAFSLSLAIPSYLAAFAWVSWTRGINFFECLYTSIKSSVISFGCDVVYRILFTSFIFSISKIKFDKRKPLSL